MPELRTREQAAEYLAQIHPGRQQWRIYQFPYGWICRAVLTPQQRAAGKGLGLTALVINSETGVVLRYPSWSIERVADDYTRTEQTGQPPNGRQIYPYRRRVTMQRTQETIDTIQYQIRIESLIPPIAPPTEYPVTIDKNTLDYRPTGGESARVTSRGDRIFSQTGTWPDHETYYD